MHNTFKFGSFFTNLVKKYAKAIQVLFSKKNLLINIDSKNEIIVD